MTLPAPYYSADGITLFLGDCREILPEIDPGGCLLITDPPYGIAYQTSMKGDGRNAGWRNTQIAGDADTTCRDFALAWIGNGPGAVFGSPKIARRDGWRGVLIWDKGPQSGMGDLSFPWKPSWEEIAVYGFGWTGRRDEGVLKQYPMVSRECMGRVHPNEKPAPLCAHLLDKAPGGLIVVDPFAGSGSVLVAAKQLGRRALGIEIEEKYCRIIVERLRQRELPLATKPREPAPEQCPLPEAE